MNILFDHQIFIAQKFGGISRYFNELAKFNDANISIEKIDLSYFSHQHDVPKSDLFSRITNYAKRKVGINNINNLNNLKFPIELTNLLQSDKFDIFHPTYYDSYFLEYSTKPFVLTVYDMIHEIYPEYFSLQDSVIRNKKLLCEKATRIIAISEQTKKDLIDIFKVPEEKIDVTLLASDFSLVVPSKPTIQREIKKYILFVGNRDGYKNFYFTAIALADILLSDNDIELLCTGKPFTKDEIAFLSNFGIQNKVHNIYLNSDNELAWAYANAEVFIFSSLYEGFGFPMLEAFASKCPVVSSSGGSLPEVGGNAALYFNPKSIREIQDATASVLYNPLMRTQLIAKGSERLMRFTWDKCRTETIEVYKKALVV